MSKPNDIQLLYIEDNSGLVRLLQRRLGRQNYIIDSANDGQEGLDKIETGAYHVILLDQNLPTLSGIEILRILHEREFFTPIIMLTGAGNERVAVEALKLGAKDYIVKDTKAGYIELLPTVIERVLQTAGLESEKRAAEDALRNSERRFRDLVENSLGLIYVHNLDGILQSVNPAVANLFGYTSQEMLGHSLAEFLIKSQKSDFHDYLTQIQQDEIASGLLHIMTQGGEERILLYRNIRYQSTDGIPYVIGHAVDITERQQQQEQLKELLAREKELSDYRSRLLTMLSHEFRTPMSIIKTSASIMQRYQERLTPDRMVSHLNTITRQVSLLDDTLSDILYSYESDTNVIQLHLDWIELDQICNNSIDQLQLSAEATHKIRREIIGTPQPVYLDEKLLQRIINNLLTNAIKYSPDGGEIILELHYEDEQVSIHVQDNGIGIPDDELNQLFMTFYRGTNVSNIPGTGIGLSIVKHAVDIHNGSINVSSEIDKGTRFSICLPISTTIEE